MPAYGTKRTLPRCEVMSAFGGKADIMRTRRTAANGPKRTVLSWGRSGCASER
jgi:hypothetical protein